MKDCPHCGKDLLCEKPWIVTEHIQREYKVIAKTRKEAVKLVENTEQSGDRKLIRVSCVSAIWKGKHSSTDKDDKNE